MPAQWFDRVVGKWVCARPATPPHVQGKPSATWVLTCGVLLGRALSLRATGHHLCKRKAELPLLWAFSYYARQRKGVKSKEIRISKIGVKKQNSHRSHRGSTPGFLKPAVIRSSFPLRGMGISRNEPPQSAAFRRITAPFSSDERDSAPLEDRTGDT